MDKPITIYGAKGFGSAPVEAALTLIGLPYELVAPATGVQVADDDAIARVNPLRQVPALILPGGEVMTESAAILIWLADRYPEARLAPPPLHRKRAAFLRWMSFVSAAIYALFWVRDDPSRVIDGEAEGKQVRARIAERIATCWRVMDSQIEPGRYLLGADLSVLDLYVTVVSRWSPRRKRFYTEAPKMAPVVRRVDADARLAAFWAERFPFDQGWEG
ncbi:MAG TPA: glutathione S-transferase family protein [Caulobacteraceae bacterium]|nr:glutathione S-transferase family protein [Caulobacteraceae bacterium]